MILQASTLLLQQLKQASTVLVANYQVPNSNNWAGINSHDCYHRLDFYAASPALPIAINVAVAFFLGGGTPVTCTKELQERRFGGQGTIY